MNNESKFDYAVNVVLEHEGRLSNNKKDPGGLTNWGISIRFLKAHGLDIDQDGDIDEQDIIILTKPHAKELYKEHWWLKYQYYLIQDNDVCAKTFDLAVNMPANSAHKLLQLSVNRLRNKPIGVDGIIGEQTLEAVNNECPLLIMDEFRISAKNYYISIVNAKPQMTWALKGWLNRAAW